MAAGPIACAVPADVAAFIAGGGRDVELGRVPAAAGVAAGAHLRLEDERGEELGLAIADPDNERLRLLAVAADGFPRLDGALYGWRVERALAWRRQLGLPGDDACYRILHGAGDGVPGFACDVLGAHAVLYAYAPALLPAARLLAEAVRGFLGLGGVVVKVRARGGAADVPQEVVGAAPPERYVAHEHGVPFEIHPHGGLNVGLFTDMREQRRPGAGVGRFAAGRTVLNLFSYTGALSVACARAGAAQVTSVDTSAGVQAWAQGNFARAGLAAGDRRWRFETGDAVRFLQRAVKTRERHDVVLIDPPTFSPARGTPWTLERDYPPLIALAAEVAGAGGVLWLAANSHELGSLPRLVAKGLRAAGRTGAIVEQAGLPPDYPTVAAQARDRYLQLVVVRLG
ncbi:MAG TPA: class I SAM-dependent methyltransferase [Kofleriaceae bacterium]|nr:class I SAM-dependent methyltransferase [Kofleriaceae bacterium]